ncbi:MAG: EndoU domain-containing protein [Actinobacteria bacterium]|nr:EndoU domain-containing protein [Actinomycetota bacterium]MCA1721537.1 EndoU domain-containing protein [Actinomycetota bacterium]
MDDVDDRQVVHRQLRDGGFLGRLGTCERWWWSRGRCRLRLPDAFPRHIADLRPDRRRHILDGDGPNKGGGHRPGVGKAGKTEFPADWTDDDIIRRVMQTAMRPDRVEPSFGKFVALARHDGVTVRVVVRADGHVWTAYPLPGGKGVVQNPGAKT